MALTGSDKAYLYARSGLARSGATRSNYVSQFTGIEWIVRDAAGQILSRVDLGDVVLSHSLHVNQAINDQPDTCSFVIGPQGSAAVPKVGDEIRVTSVPTGGTLFHGTVLTVQQDWRLGGLQPPWTAVQCVDPLWRFDARMVTYRFPAQSVTASIAWLVRYFCNPAVAHPLDFTTTFVQADMPTLPAFDVVNQRPSTVMRTLTQSVAGGFYIVGLDVHAWANSVSEPGQQNPADLIPHNPTLLSFRITRDAQQLRRRVLVEGRRSATLISLPAVNKSQSMFLGVPVEDATLFNLAAAPDTPQLCRIGTQWVYARNPVSVRAGGANPPQTKTHAVFTPGDAFLYLKAMPVAPPPHGWIRVGNQFSRYALYTGTPTTDGWYLHVAVSAFPYGVFTVPIPAEETVEWVDAVMSIEPHGLRWGAPGTTTDGENDLIRAQPTSAPVVTLAEDAVPFEAWPELEGFVQDGRYSYAGAQARAHSDVAAFALPVDTMEWDTTDPHAAPGRLQGISLIGETFPTAIIAAVTIRQVAITFPLWTLPPRRRCLGSEIQPSTFLDIVLTSTS